MPMHMESDLNRFRKIVRGKVKKELRRFISSGDLIGRQGKKTVTIPLPRIDIPHFQFGSNQQGGVGQGEGEVGDQVGQGQPEDGEGKAGDGEGQRWRSTSRWKSWPRFSARSSSSRTSRTRARRTSTTSSTSTPGS
jgi:uncharacterized sporulation protein YeaH/YhbH (DUF444 family)